MGTLMVLTSCCLFVAAASHRNPDVISNMLSFQGRPKPGHVEALQDNHIKQLFANLLGRRLPIRSSIESISGKNQANIIVNDPIEAATVPEVMQLHRQLQNKLGWASDDGGSGSSEVKQNQYGPPQQFAQQNSNQQYGPPPQEAPRNNYGPPQEPPRNNYGPPLDASRNNYGPPPEPPRNNYGPPQEAPRNNYGPPQEPPRTNYGVPQEAPRNNYGPPPEPPRNNYGPPQETPRNNYGPPPEPPRTNYGAPQEAPRNNYGPPPEPPRNNYGPPQEAPRNNYGPPQEAPRNNYGPPQEAPRNNYGPPGGFPPSDGYGGPPPPAPGQTFSSPPPSVNEVATDYKAPTRVNQGNFGGYIQNNLKQSAEDNNHGGYNDAGEHGGSKIYKHVYIHTPPPEDEVRPETRVIRPQASGSKHYQIVFIKSPTPQAVRTEIELPPEPERKTLVYVLVKRPTTPEIKFKTQPATAPPKPEVFFIKYKDKDGLREEEGSGGYANAISSVASPPADLNLGGIRDDGDNILSKLRETVGYPNTEYRAMPNMLNPNQEPMSIAVYDRIRNGVSANTGSAASSSRGQQGSHYTAPGSQPFDRPSGKMMDGQYMGMTSLTSNSVSSQYYSPPDHSERGYQ